MNHRKGGKNAGASPGRNRPDKRQELAQHALLALAELGFARLNLREIATRSGVALGVIHYYFKDKKELLIYCVGLYKDAFIQNLEEQIASADNLAALKSQFITALVHSVEEQGHIHRLWYDIRAQALFDAAFHPVVDDHEARLIGVVQQLLDKIRALGGQPEMRKNPVALDVYLILDGWFRYFLQQHLGGNPQASTLFRQRLERLFPLASPELP
ncbi:MAG: TetR/AcrR family transcriptional regulator [Acidocella sp.]|uniref:TetR/AcrR family transcriptional regulator n=1 Tax=Acidocella sp. TaxID=50710 RepID=UPI003FD827FC